MILDLISNVSVLSVDFISALVTLFTGDFLPVLADTSGLVSKIRDFIGPILGLILGLIALTFLMRREFMQFMIFLGIALLVFAVFYVPDFIQSLGKSVGESADSDITWD